MVTKVSVEEALEGDFKCPKCGNEVGEVNFATCDKEGNLLDDKEVIVEFEDYFTCLQCGEMFKKV